MAVQYQVKIIETKEPIEVEGGYNYEDRIAQLTAEGKLKETTKPLLFPSSRPPTIQDFCKAVDNMVRVFRDTENYPYVKGELILQ